MHGGTSRVPLGAKQREAFLKLGFLLYAVMAVSAAVGAFLGTDEAAKYIEAETLFWARGINVMVSGIALTLKGYTSKSFAEWHKNKTETSMWKKDTGP